MDLKAGPESTAAPVPNESQSANKRGTIMATIEDDDERLLNRIGYTQVSPLHTPQAV